MVDLTKRLSPHFTLGEMIHTSHRTIDNTPTLEVVDRLAVLCEEFLEKVRQHWGPLWVNSGYRCLELNTAIGGSPTSAHMHGCAADFVPMYGWGTSDIAEWIMKSTLPYDQVIDEYSTTGNWIHLGMARPGKEPRRQALTMRHGEYRQFTGL